MNDVSLYLNIFDELKENSRWKSLLAQHTKESIADINQETKNVIKSFLLRELSSAPADSDYFSTLYNISYEVPESYTILENRFEEIINSDFHLGSHPQTHLVLINAIGKNKEIPYEFIKENLENSLDGFISNEWQHKIPQDALEGILLNFDSYFLRVRFHLLRYFVSEKEEFDTKWIKEKIAKVLKEYERCPLDENDQCRIGYDFDKTKEEIEMLEGFIH